MLLKGTVAAAIATLAAQTATALPLEGDVSPKIVGGVDSPEGSFPFLVSLSSGGRHFCGGSLLNEDTILTASHCFEKPLQQLQVRAGSNDRTTGGQVSGVIDIIRHPQYNPTTHDNDVAILKISPPVNKNAAVEFAKLAQEGTYPKPGQKRVAGWGQIQPGSPSGLPPPTKKREVEVNSMTHPQCQQIYQWRNLAVTGNMVCAKAQGKDSCSGDSGGPLLDASTGELEGVVSWGLGCADQQFPAVYAAMTVETSHGGVPIYPLGGYVHPINPGGGGTDPDDFNPSEDRIDPGVQLIRDVQVSYDAVFQIF
ncbi:Peptidase S1/S6, chymotrypsin/Hap [Metarhizium robertsii ARSEF 23]|uniref:Peptidase S1/S6, chymotrypsin/Hap n=1 Tax=Metarhizium robertsii (strain ARSEF 23 / ATCC MYA-3075) TaxID=655844 RepID=E9FDZ6_METRA|nr:Peptidase S1/S6, chymotrypsin/Hap [Metarhizium robertsii ARSEF 23]EFY94045.1 Peptidase S1/S6, chymotrypsin/Hap [Metarhizium robertsii ARSEF 23]